MKIAALVVSLALPAAALAAEEVAAPQSGQSGSLPQVQLPADLLSDPADEPAVTAERLIDEQEQHIRRLRALQRRAELQAAERDVQKAVAETEQARADAEKARAATKPPAPKIVHEHQGTPPPHVPAPALVGVANGSAVLDYAGAVRTLALKQRVNGWLLREIGFDYVVLEGPGGVVRRQELGW